MGLPTTFPELFLMVKVTPIGAGTKTLISRSAVTFNLIEYLLLANISAFLIAHKPMSYLQHKFPLVDRMRRSILKSTML